MQNKTFRLFISSTFSDFNQERRLLQTYVFPYIKQYCIDLNKGYTFQPIDLRWGVSNEAQLDQKALALCIEEVQSSKSQPHPNFLIMAGDRYGWVPCPYIIKEDEYIKIREYIKSHNEEIEIEYWEYKDANEDIEKSENRNTDRLELLDQWYEKDENQIETSYILQQRENNGFGNYLIYENWGPEEEALRKLLQLAVKNIDISDKEKYFTSATEAEVTEGIFKYIEQTKYQKELRKKDKEYETIDYDNIFGYIRNIQSIKDKNFSDKFLDEDYLDDKSRIQRFKKELKGSIKEDNLLKADNSHLINLSQDENNGSLNYSYEAIENEKDSKFVTTMIEYLKRSIDEFDAKYNQEDDEKSLGQENFKDAKLKLFLGREEPLKAIKDYIGGNSNQAMVIHGKSGLGKSALMAKSIEQTKNKPIYRFIGSIASLSTSSEVLISILDELGIQEEIGMVKDSQTGQDKSEDIEKFYSRVHDHLRNLEDEKIIFIDAVDQFSNKDEFIWIPKELPSNLKIIISALEDETYPDDSKYFESIKHRTSNLYPLEAFTDAKGLVTDILKEYDRTIQTAQLTYLETKYKDINSPLYITIAAQEMRHWKSTDIPNDEGPDKKSLASTQKEIITEFIDNLHSVYHHDKDFVKRVFSYIYLADGLSESELLEIISIDDEFIKKLAPDTFHNNVTEELPTVIWARLHTQIKEFLKLEKKDGFKVMKFFHREFNSVIYKQEDIELYHEKLITHIQRLVLSYLDKAFDNRFGKLYIDIVLRLRRKQIFKTNEILTNLASIGLELVIDEDESKSLLDIQSNMLEEQVKFILELNNDNLYKKFFSYIIESNTFKSEFEDLITNSNITSKDKIYKQANYEFNYLIFISLYNNNKMKWSYEYAHSLSSLSHIYIDIGGKLEESIRLGRKAFEISKLNYNKSEKWSKVHYNIINNLCMSLERKGDALNKFNKFKDVEAAMQRKETLLETIYLRLEAYELSKTLHHINDILINASGLILSYKYLGEMEVSMERLERLESAEKIFKETILIIENEDTEDFLQIHSVFLSNGGQIYNALGQNEQAISILDDAIKLSEKLLKKDLKEYILTHIVNYYNLMFHHSDLWKNIGPSIYKENAYNISLIIIELCEKYNIIDSDIYKDTQEISLKTSQNDPEESTLLHSSVEYGNIENLKYYIKRGAYVNVINEKGYTPLHLAAMIGNYEITQLLLDNEAKIDIQDKEGGTPLSWSSYNGHTAIVRLFLEKGADANLSDFEGNTSLDWAIQENHSEIIDLLKRYGAKQDNNSKLIELLQIHSDKQSLDEEGQEGSIDDLQVLDEKEQDDLVEDSVDSVEQYLELLGDLINDKKGYNEPITVLLYIAKGLAIYHDENEIGMAELFAALNFVECNEEATNVFSQIFGNALDEIKDVNGGDELIKIAKSNLVINYSDEVKSLVKDLKEYFGDDNIIKVR
jgi:hypothetical protein